MANPFGGNDEALSANTGHAKYSNLKYALVPRSVSKWRDVLSSADLTPDVNGGSYDADGYFFGPSSTTNSTITKSISSSYLTSGGAKTIIVGFNYLGTPGGAAMNFYGLYSSSQGHVINFIEFDTFDDRVRRRCVDYNFNDANSAFLGSVSTGSFAVVQKTVDGAQKNYLRRSTTNTGVGTDGTVSLGTGANDNLDRLRVVTYSRIGVQYIFVYDATLTDGECDGIIDSPGGVISYSGGGGGIPKSTKFFLMGIG
jgi:hypothetical protein